MLTFHGRFITRKLFLTVLFLFQLFLTKVQLCYFFKNPNVLTSCVISVALKHLKTNLFYIFYYTSKITQKAF